MRKLFTITALAVFSLMAANAQDTLKTKKPKRDWSKANIPVSASDHLVFQVGADGWSGKPDSIRTKGLSYHFNVYIMFDKPFKTDPRFSIGYGAGIGSSSISLKNTLVDVIGKTAVNKLVFTNADSLNHYKKYKLATIYAEIPLELRYVKNPEKPNSSLKLALGLKGGFLLDAHTKGKEPQDKSGTTLNGQGKAVEKDKSKRFFNGSRIAATLRVGFGHWSLYGAYQINSMVKDGFGPQLKPWSVGICITGLH